MVKVGRPGPLTYEALLQIVDGLAGIDRAVRGPQHPDGAPRSLRLIASEAYDVWLIRWPPGGVIDKHDHGEALGVMRVVSGVLVELTPAGEVLLRSDRSVVTHPHEWHMLWNPTEEETTTVHAYSPPLEAVSYQLHLTGRALHPAGGSDGTAEGEVDRPVGGSDYPRPASSCRTRRSRRRPGGDIDGRSAGRNPRHRRCQPLSLFPPGSGWQPPF